MVKPINGSPAAHASHASHAPAPKVVARNALNKLYDANQSGNLARRPGWPDAPNSKMALTGGAEISALGLNKLPRGSKAAHAIQALIRQGIDGDQGAYTLKVGKNTYTVVAAFAEDASRDQVWIFDAKGQTQVAHATPNETTGKLIWK